MADGQTLHDGCAVHSIAWHTVAVTSLVYNSTSVLRD